MSVVIDVSGIVLLLIKYWIPPHIQDASSPLRPPDEKTSQIKATAILRDEHIHGLRVIDVWDIGYIERIVDPSQSAVCNFIETGEDLGVERAGGLHDVSMLDCQLNGSGMIPDRATRTIRGVGIDELRLGWYRFSPMTLAIRVRICA
jgi:hypothetical protein